MKIPTYFQQTEEILVLTKYPFLFWRSNLIFERLLFVDGWTFSCLFCKNLYLS